MTYPTLNEINSNSIYAPIGYEEEFNKRIIKNLKYSYILMSVRQQLTEELNALPITHIKKIVSKYNKELDIKPISRKKKAEIISMITSKKPLNKVLFVKLLNEAKNMRSKPKTEPKTKPKTAPKKEEPKKEEPKKKESKTVPKPAPKKDKPKKEKQPKLPPKKVMVDGAAEVAINAIYSILEQEDRPLEDWEDVGGIDINTEAYLDDLFKELKIFDNPELESKTYRLIDVDVEKKVAKSFKNAIKERNKKEKKKKQKKGKK